jgi:hypothetical protein
VRGIRLQWNQSGKNPAPNPAEELFDRLIEPYHPYLSDMRVFDRSRTESIDPGLSSSPFTYDIFERCMAYAVACDWGKKAGSPHVAPRKAIGTWSATTSRFSSSSNWQ